MVWREITFLAPAYWSSYLINGDDSSLEPGEKERADQYVDAQVPKGAVGFSVVSCDDEAHFSWSYDLHGGDAEGGDLVKYTALYSKPSRVKQNS